MYAKLVKKNKSKGIWDFVKNIKGVPTSIADLISNYDSIDKAVNSINEFFASKFNPSSCIHYENIDSCSAFDCNTCFKLVDVVDVFNCLERISVHKAMGADEIPN